MAMAAKRSLSGMVYLERFDIPSLFKPISEEIKIIAELSRASLECFSNF